MKYCPNCGAPLTKDKCDYCGTDFAYLGNISEDGIGYIVFKDEHIPVYVEEIEYSQYGLDWFRNEIGMMVKAKPKMHRKFVLVEY